MVKETNLGQTLLAPSIAILRNKNTYNFTQVDTMKEQNKSNNHLAYIVTKISNIIRKDYIISSNNIYKEYTLENNTDQFNSENIHSKIISNIYKILVYRFIEIKINELYSILKNTQIIINIMHDINILLSRNKSENIEYMLIENIIKSVEENYSMVNSWNSSLIKMKTDVEYTSCINKMTKISDCILDFWKNFKKDDMLAGKEHSNANKVLSLNAKSPELNELYNDFALIDDPISKLRLTNSEGKYLLNQIDKVLHCKQKDFYDSTFDFDFFKRLHQKYQYLYKKKKNESLWGTFLISDLSFPIKIDPPEFELQSNVMYQHLLNIHRSRKSFFMHSLSQRKRLMKFYKENYFHGLLQGCIFFANLVLEMTALNSIFSKEFSLDYSNDSRILIVNYQLPTIDDIPTLKEVQYIKSRNVFKEKHITKSQHNMIYENVLYQIPVILFKELIELDTCKHIRSIAFNGFVKTHDPATGVQVNPCILSMLVNRDEINEINMLHVDPKSCFKKLKGVSSAKISSLTPVPPLLQMETEDKRFIASYDVVSSLDEDINIAAMEWDDFEHLIREIFEKEYSDSGGEVKVTRASRDGGVDAVVFDPDPLRGGKIIIQAKRYTNVVGVSSVRDLYGTLLNEGANKGILVTTSSYGPDAYNFAKGKPLLLIDGNNLLHLLQKHGHKAKIDIPEAKKILIEKQKHNFAAI